MLINICLIVVIIITGSIISIYNKFIRKGNKVKEATSGIDVLLNQRFDLIPNIVETVKGYSNHEKESLTEIINTRNKVLKSSSKKETIESNEKLGQKLENLFILTESYPELKADTNFINLQNNLKEIENKISLSRTDYNKAVLNYKNKLEMFPSNFVGQMFNFKPELFFEIDKEEKENPKVKF